MTISILGIDIGKNSCSVVGVDDKGAVLVRRTMRRQTLIEFVCKMPRASLLWKHAAALTTFGDFSQHEDTKCDHISMEINEARHQISTSTIYHGIGYGFAPDIRDKTVLDEKGSCRNVKRH